MPVTKAVFLALLASLAGRTTLPSGGPVAMPILITTSVQVQKLLLMRIDDLGASKLSYSSKLRCDDPIGGEALAIIRSTLRRQSQIHSR